MVSLKPAKGVDIWRQKPHVSMVIAFPLLPIKLTVSVPTHGVAVEFGEVTGLMEEQQQVEVRMQAGGFGILVVQF